MLATGAAAPTAAVARALISSSPSGGFAPDHEPSTERCLAMRLRSKFNLAVLAAFLIGFAGAGVFLQRLFVENARQQVLQNARIMMSAADAVSHFTDQYVGPLAEPINNSGTRFVAASIPFF